MLAFVFADPAAAEIRNAGRVLTVTASANAVDITLEDGVARLETIADDILRVRFAPSGTFTSRRSGATVAVGAVAAGFFDTPGTAYILTSKLIAVVIKEPFRLIVFRADGSLVQADLDPAVSWDTTTGSVLTRKWAPADEHYFGLGERGGPLDRRGRRFAMRNGDYGAYGELADPLYVTIPFFWGMRRAKAYGFFLDNPAVPFVQFDDDGSGTLVAGAADGELDYYLFAGPSPSDVIGAYARVTGMPALPPKWSLGYHQSRYGYSSATEILTVAASLRQLRIPADAIHFDIDYLDRQQMFTWNPATFPDPIGMNATLDRFGFKRVNISEPLVRTDDRLWPFVVASQFLVTRPDGQPNVTDIWYGNVGWFDFTKWSAVRWYMDVLKSFLSTGITATWNDLNEPAANYMFDAVFDFNGDPRTDTQARNLYALYEDAASYQAQLELRPNVRPWVLSRSGYAGVHRYAANWGGDQTATFDSMRVSAQMTNSMALSGQNQYGHDVGGFLGSPSAELFLRWLELSSFSTFFRNHAINSSAPREPWAFGEPYLSMAREIINERYRLMPYLYSAMALASQTGVPAVAPTLFHFPGDTTTYRQDADFMFGASMLVAPVLEPGASGKIAYLPAGADWFDAYTDTRYAGGLYAAVAAPLDRIPIFIRAGAIIPKGPVTQFVDAQPLSELHVQLYPGPESTFHLYEDDGASFEYLSGVFLDTAIVRRDVPSGMTCRIKRVRGAWLPPADRVWWLELHAIDAPSSATVNGAIVPHAASDAELAVMTYGWTRRADGRVVVRVPDSSQPIDVVVSR